MTQSKSTNIEKEKSDDAKSGWVEVDKEHSELKNNLFSNQKCFNIKNAIVLIDSGVVLKSKRQKMSKSLSLMQ